MERVIDDGVPDYRARAFVTVQDLGIKALIQVSQAEVSIEESNRLIFISVPEAWRGVAVALANLKCLMRVPIELQGFTVEIVLAENPPLHGDVQDAVANQ